MKTPFPVISDENFLSNIKILTSSITEGVIITDANENILWVNPAFEKICGYKFKKLAGRRPDILQGIDTDKKTVSSIRKKINERKPVDVELINYKPDKTPYWIKLNITPIYNKNKELTHFIAFEHDITEEKNNEIKIKESEAFYRSLFETNPGIMFIFDPDTYKFLEVNEAALNTYGYSREEFLNLTLKDIRPAEDWKAVVNDIKTVDEDIISRGTWRHKNKKGEIFFVEIKASNIFFNGKKAIIVIPNNITERINFENELQEQLKFIREISDSIPGGILQTVYYPDNRIEVTFISDGFEQLWGFSSLEVINDVSKRLKAIHPEDIEEVKADIENAVKNLISIDHKFRYINQKTNEIKWVRAKVHPERKPNGSVVLNGVFLDITESENYYLELEKSNERYKYISKAANETIWEWDLKTNILEMGGNYKKMFGYSFPDDKVNFSFVLSKIHPEDLDNLQESIKRALTDTENQFRENYFRIFRNDNTIAHVYERSYTIFDTFTKEPLKIYGTTQDITQRKNDEEQLKKNEKFLTEISESMQGFIFQTEYDNSYVAKLNYASRNAYDYWGFSVEEVMNDQTKLLDSIHYEDISDVVNKRLESVKNLTNMNIKFRYVNKKTGEIKWVRAMAVPTRLDNGHTLVNGTIVDITETENYYNKLEEATRRYEYLSKATHETIWEMDLKTYEILLGGGYKEMFGEEFPENKMSFKDWEKYIHPEDLAKVESTEVVASEKKKRYWEGGYRLVRKDGKTFNVFERAYIVYDEKNIVPLKIIGSTQDVTELTKVQEERDKMFSDLLKRNSALEQFTYMVSHNLRAPIANILGISALLEENNLDEESRLEMNQLIKKSSSRLDEVIRDMNDILSIKKRFEEDKSEVVFETILSEIKNIEEHAIQNSGIKIISDFAAKRSMYSVKSFIYSIFQNLVTNSVKYKSDGASFIKITSSEDADYIYLKFEDNGIGIDLLKNKEKIFGLYNRFHLHKEGKGMGLFMVKSQVESMNGEIYVESEVDKGTTFTIKFKKS
ncbi:MAG: PAS domain S-box protein [Bacteroidetes bacterium]|nr:PAS domain S-box protein [Bacteroidota bacterium]